MYLQNTPIRQKVMLIVLLVSGLVSVLTCLSLAVFEYVTFRRTMEQQLTTLGSVIATNSTAALAFENERDATAILAALQAEPHVVAAGLYNHAGRLFARYPAAAQLPPEPGAAGFHYGSGTLEGFQPVALHARPLGTLFLRYDMAPLYERLRLYGALVLAVMGISLILAYAVSATLQARVSGPILALADAARRVSEQQDYSVRVTRRGDDEVGGLTGAFNQMLERIERQDRTLRENRSQLETIIEHLGEGLAVSDPQGQLLHFNRAALELHGFTSLLECRRHLREFALLFELRTREGAVLPVDQWPLARVLRGESLRHVDLRVRRLDSAATHIFDYGGTLVRDEDGRASMAVVTIADVTEQQRAADEIRALNQTLEQRVRDRTAQLEAANQELEAFSYSVSHDLRAPLRHVDGFAQLLARHAGAGLDEKGRHYLETISESTHRLGQLIDELLVFSRMGRVEMRRTDVDSRALVGEVLHDLQPEVQGRQIDWVVAELPPVKADPAMLRQVWVNLLANAVKYTRRQPAARVEVAHRTNGDGEHIFSVRDNGAGFDMRYADKLFGVFQRLHAQTEFEGTGIGLANVRRIVQRHGGRTWAEGSVGAGATFYFSLPSRPAAPSVP